HGRLEAAEAVAHRVAHAHLLGRVAGHVSGAAAGGGEAAHAAAGAPAHRNRCVRGDAGERIIGAAAGGPHAPPCIACPRAAARHAAHRWRLVPLDRVRGAALVAVEVLARRTQADAALAAGGAALRAVGRVDVGATVGVAPVPGNDHVGVVPARDV